MTLADLPPQDTKRWVIQRKAEIVTAVEQGLLSEREACDRYSLTQEEFRRWECICKEQGKGGLRLSRLSFRRLDEKQKRTQKE